MDRLSHYCVGCFVSCPTYASQWFRVRLCVWVGPGWYRFSPTPNFFLFLGPYYPHGSNFRGPFFFYEKFPNFGKFWGATPITHKRPTQARNHRNRQQVRRERNQNETNVNAQPATRGRSFSTKSPPTSGGISGRNANNAKRPT